MSLPHGVDAPINCDDWDEVVDSLEWQCYGWIIYPEGGEYHAKKGDTMVIAYSNANPEAVFQYVFNNCANGDSIFVKNGSYPFGDTATLATTGAKHYIHIIGESKNARIRPPSGDWAFEIGDPLHTTSYCERLMIENLMFWPVLPQDGSGLKIDYSFLPVVKDCDFFQCDTGLQISYTNKSKIVRCNFQGFDTRGLYFPTSASGTVADEYIFQSYFESTQDNSIGMEVEYDVNGILINDCLFSGTGVNPALKITASFSGIWINNSVFDAIGDNSLASNGIEILGSADSGCADIQFTNTWIQSCWGHGLYIEGQTNLANRVTGAQFSNCLFGNNQKTGVFIKNAEFMYFDNCRFELNGAADNAADYEMAQLLVEEYGAHLLFDNCEFRGAGGLTNPQYVVILDSDNTSTVTAKLSDCYLYHETNQNNALIAYDRAAAGDALYVYAHDVYSRINAGAGVVITQIGAQVANQAQNVDCKNIADGWPL